MSAIDRGRVRLVPPHDRVTRSGESVVMTPDGRVSALSALATFALDCLTTDWLTADAWLARVEAEYGGAADRETALAALVDGLRAAGVIEAAGC